MIPALTCTCADTRQHGTAKRGMARHGAAPPSTERHSTARHSPARLDTARHRTARHGPARPGTTLHGTARPDTAWRGSAMHGVDPDGALEWSREPPPVAAGEPVGVSLRIQSLDAALVAPGVSTDPYEWDRYNDAAVDPLEGAAFNLHNNLYDTNYVLWYPWRAADSMSRFRFLVSVQ